MCEEDELRTRLAESIFTLFSRNKVPYCDNPTELGDELISFKDVAKLVVDIWDYGFEPPIEFYEFLEYCDYTDDLTGCCFNYVGWNHIFGKGEFGFVPQLYNISKACNDIIENPEETRYRVDISIIKSNFNENKNDPLKQLADLIFSNLCRGKFASDDTDEIAYLAADNYADAVENAFGSNPYDICKALDSFVKEYRYKEPITGVSDTFAGWWNTFRNNDETMAFVEDLYNDTLADILTLINQETGADHL